MTAATPGTPSRTVPFIRPARLAATDPNEQVKEPIGSGPYRFVRAEWQPGHQVVYARRADDVPHASPGGARRRRRPPAAGT
jgi:peptide/nickel transport system substrate-binding protein